MKYNFLIVDDEDSGRQSLRVLLDKLFWAHFNPLDFANSIESARSCLEKKTYDIVFLDINLKGVSGFELLPYLPESTKVVFVTAYSEHVLQALRSKAFDYLIKPIKEQELSECIERFIKEHQRQDSNKSLVIKNKGLSRIINLSDIVYIEGDGPYITFHLQHDTIKVAKTLKVILLELNDSFIRIHKSYVVNRGYIKGFNTDKLILLNDTCLPVSRKGFKELRGV